MYGKVLFGLIALGFITMVQSYSSGAPVSDEICTSLRPNHPGEPQTQKLPYKLQVNKRVVKPFEVVSLSITGRQPFKGFLVQGRNENFEKDNTPIGSFISTGQEENIQAIDCLNLENSSVTHRNGIEKRNVTISWQAPKERGNYVLL